MNVFNQLAASMHARLGEEDPRLFALADYLRLVLRCGNVDKLSVHEEFLLLQSYIQLVARNRPIDLSFEFSPGAEEEGGHGRLVQRHLACDLVGAVLKALPGGGASATRLRIGFENGGPGCAYVLHASLVCPDAAEFERRLRNELDGMADRFDLPGGGPKQSYGRSGTHVTWSATVVGQPAYQGAV
ncbi:MAG: hypothetical protein J0H69_23605 [Burkholderiales bacterium]|nr:hypothetical protein [Burkholderiales bacterium]